MRGIKLNGSLRNIYFFLLQVVCVYIYLYVRSLARQIKKP